MRKNYYPRRVNRGKSQRQLERERQNPSRSELMLMSIAVGLLSFLGVTVLSVIIAQLAR